MHRVDGFFGHPLFFYYFFIIFYFKEAELAAVTKWDAGKAAVNIT